MARTELVANVAGFTVLFSHFQIRSAQLRHSGSRSKWRDSDTVEQGFYAGELGWNYEPPVRALTGRHDHLILPCPFAIASPCIGSHRVGEVCLMVRITVLR